MFEHKDDKRNFVYIRETADVEKVLPRLMQRKVWGTDTETTGLDPFKDNVILAQFGCKEEQILIDTRTASLAPLKPFFDSKEHRKILHYAKFDYKMFRQQLGLELEGMRCTWLTEKVIQAGRMHRGFSLEEVIFRRLGIELDKTLQKSFVGHTGPFTLPQLIYGADDVLHLEDLYRHQCEEASRDNLARTVQLESEVCSAFCDMELDGMYLDVPGWRKIIEDNIEGQSQVKRQLDEIAIQYVGEDLFGEANINYGSSEQVVYLLNQMGVTVPVRNPKTGKDEMMKITHSDAKSLKRINNLPIIQLLGKWRSYNVLINTFGEPFLKAINPITGRIHPDLDQLGTDTGRPAAGGSDVNPLNVPRDNRYRHCFIGGPDEIVESDDYSGCESRILAEISGDPRLIEIFQKGEDIHCAVATDLYGIKVEKKGPNSKYRTPAKSLNFGIAYGMGPGRLYNELNAAGFPVTFEEAKRLFDKYCSTYKTAVDFLRNSGKIASKEGFLSNLNGRRRYWRLPDYRDRDKFPKGKFDPLYTGILSKIEREGGNFLIQSVNADITKQAMIWIRDYKKQNNIKTSFVNAVYDEIVTRTHKDQSAEFHKVKLDLMKKAAHVWIKNVPMEVDGAANPYWTK